MFELGESINHLGAGRAGGMELTNGSLEIPQATPDQELSELDPHDKRALLNEGRLFHK
jgi:hypothetical protein